ncbi:MAG: hypothetical protein H8F28_15660 [Fibrella sp.]|nr:hypothetical protein [Armatimonadota bacterium]
MDRNVSVTIIVLAVLVGALFWWGWRKVVGSPPAGRVSPATFPARGSGVSAAPPALEAGGRPEEPRYANNPAILSEARPSIPTVTDDQYWLWDGALLATRSLEDLLAYNQEDDRPPVGYPNGTTRNQSGQTPKQRELLSAGHIVLIPTAARVNVVNWGGNDLVQVRIEEGAKAGVTGWISRHLLRYNRNGVFEPVYPVEIK